MNPKTTFSFGAGPAFAALASGAVFCAALGLGAFLNTIPEPIPIEPDAGPMIFAFVVAATFYGTIVALLPCLIGSAAMGWLGCHVPFSRLAPFWALAGMLPIGGVALATGITADGAALTFAFIVTAAACGLICRRFVKWSDKAPGVTQKTSFHRLETDPRLLR